MEKSKTDRIEDIAKRRGFFWQASEIYGGLSGFYDYGHLGALVKRKFEQLWRNFFLSMNDNFYEIDACNIMPEAVFTASGHLTSFVDPIVKCKNCGYTERADQLIEQELHESFEGLAPEELSALIKKHKIRCPKCEGELEDVGILNMMFPIKIGTGDDARSNDDRRSSSGSAYLRPETAQGVYVNFSREFECLRKKMPLGLAIVGKAYRNEISPRNLLIRMREFTQAELQIFFDPDKIETHEEFDDVSDYKLMLFSVVDRKIGTVDEMPCREAVKRLHLPQFYVFHLAKIQQFYLDLLKLPPDKFRFRELSEEERAFYNKIHWDVELYLEGLGGWKEVGGLHYRGEHDLGGHQKVSKQDLSVNIDGKKFLPHVLELSFGVDRNVYALLELAYEEEKDRTMLRFPRAVSPYDAGVFPLLNKDDLPGKARDVYQMLKAGGFSVFYDESGSIGRRYRRMDEIGVAASITIDHTTLEDDTITLRDRDTMEQVRLRISDLANSLKKFIAGEDIEKLGKLVK